MVTDDRVGWLLMPIIGGGGCGSCDCDVKGGYWWRLVVVNIIHIGIPFNGVKTLF